MHPADERMMFGESSGQCLDWHRDLRSYPALVQFCEDLRGSFPGHKRVQHRPRGRSRVLRTVGYSPNDALLNLRAFTMPRGVPSSPQCPHHGSGRDLVMDLSFCGGEPLFHRWEGKLVKFFRSRVLKIGWFTVKVVSEWSCRNFHSFRPSTLTLLDNIVEIQVPN